jgi:RNA polymerase sigma-70 factor (ECF subfamily)
MSRAHAPIDAEALLAEAGWVRRIARSLVADSSSADDLAQEALRVALEHPPARIPSRPALRGWLARVIHSLALRSFQRDTARSARERFAALAAISDEQHETEARMELHQRLVEAIRSLDEPYRSAIRLRYLDELSLKELARIQRISYATARQRVSRGIALLRAQLDREYGGDRLGWGIICMGWADRGRWLVPLAEGVIMSTSAKLVTGAVVVLGIAFLLFQHGGAPGIGPPPVSRAADPGSEVLSALDSKEKPVSREAGETAPATSLAEQPGGSVPLGSLLAGRVQDRDGHPIADAAIRLGPWDPAALRYTEVGVGTATAGVSDTDGRFTVPMPTTYCHIFADKPGWTTVMPYEFAPERDNPDVIVVVGPRNEYGGLVVDEKGQGLPDVSIVAALSLGAERNLLPGQQRSHARAWRVTSNADGHFDLKDVGWTPGLELNAQSTGRVPAKLVLPETSELDLRVILAVSTDLLTGSVIDADGNPVPEASVFLDATSSVADAQGMFAFPQPDLSTAHALVAVKKDHLPARVEFGAGKDLPLPLVLVLGGPPLTIAGRTVDANGLAIANAYVWVGDKTYLDRVVHEMKGGVAISGTMATAEDLLVGASYPKQFRSGADGSFEVKGLLPRAYSVSASDPRTLAIVTSPAVEAGKKDLVLVLEEKSPAPRVAGRVLSLSGLPISGVRVWASRTIYSGPSPVHALLIEGAPVTDAEGRFAFSSLHVLDKAYLRFSGDMVFAEGVEVELDSTQSLEQLEIHIPAKCMFQVRLADPTEADFCTVLNEKSRGLEVLIRIGNTLQNTSLLWLADGLSEVVSTAETARWIVLHKGEKEVRRVPIQLTPAEVTTLRP